ncbi:MAG: hypothetical protein HGA95_00090 [Caldiserica bacterium]|nr:hypothetical protein [Caldisericota bacterium]
MPEYICGLDLGQRQDYTAFVVLEIISTKDDIRASVQKRRNGDGSITEIHNGGSTTKHIVNLDVREAVRFTLGTPYTEIVNTVLNAMAMLEPGRDDHKLVIDATNNTAVVDYLKQEHTTRRCRFEILPVSITAGGSVNYDNGMYKVPKIQLIQQTQLAFEQKILRFAQGMEYLDLLTGELENYQVTISDTGSEIYNARSREHDDLVLALALPVWYALKDGRDISSWGGVIVSRHSRY